MKDEQPVNSEERLRKARDESGKDRGNGRLVDTELRLEDFYAYMPQHRIYSRRPATVARRQRQRAHPAGRGRG